MIALAKDFFLSGKGFAALQQVAVWRFPIMLPGDVDVWDAIPLPSHALYVCKTLRLLQRAGQGWVCRCK